ncbi:MAG TPA: S8 family serine peptidase [Gaiellaceae bacterium]
MRPAPRTPAWSVPATGPEPVPWPVGWPPALTREWAWGGSTGAGVRVCILDSGVEDGHPRVGALAGAYAVDDSEGDGGVHVHEDASGDLCGHGTASAGIVRALAPGCDLTSVRVLGAGMRGSGRVLVAGLRWAVEQRFDVVNMSLSTSKAEFVALLRELTDSAYFGRTLLVTAAHNSAVESFPWRFASVVSVGSHGGDDPLEFFYNASPPVEFFARGILVDVAWRDGGEKRASGNSFATPHIAGIAALVLGRHPGLTPFQLKTVLYLTASNVKRR